MGVMELMISDTNRANQELRHKELGEGEQKQIDRKLLEILVCPISKTPLVFNQLANELISNSAGLAFPIRNGVPILLVDEARRLDEVC